MGFLNDLFDKEARRKKRIENLTKKAGQKFGQAEDRVAALHALRDEDGEDAIRGLVKRFAATTDNKLHDQDEKKLVSDMLVDIGPEAIPIIREFLRKETEVTWALKTLRRMVPQNEWIGHVLEMLGETTSEDTDPEKICQIASVLHEQKDARVAPAIARLLSDLDDTVRFAAIETLATLGDEAARAPLLEALARPDEESNRVIHRIVEVFRESGWEVKGHRKAVEERLPEHYYLDRSGRIKRFEGKAGEAPPVDAEE